MSEVRDDGDVGQDDGKEGPSLVTVCEDCSKPTESAGGLAT